MLALAPAYPGGLRSYAAFLLQEGRPAEALPIVRKVYEQSVLKGDELSMAFDGLDMAEALLQLEQCAEALTFLEGPARSLQGTRTVQLRSCVLACLGRDDEAVAGFATLDGEVPQLRLRYRHGLSLYRLGRLAEARVQLEQAVADSEPAETWNLLGVVCAEQEDWSSAVAAFGVAVELAPQHSPYRQNLLQAQARLRTGSGLQPMTR